GMERPGGARNQPVVVEDPHRTEAVVVGIAVPIEGEVPARTEPAAFDVVDLRIASDLDHRSPPARSELSPEQPPSVTEGAGPGRGSRPGRGPRRRRSRAAGRTRGRRRPQAASPPPSVTILSAPPGSTRLTSTAVVADHWSYPAKG